MIFVVAGVEYRKHRKVFLFNWKEEDMNNKIGKKLGFWGALIIMLSSVVGASVFFTNRGVSRATNYEGYTTLLAWIIGGLIALFTAISFSEIGTVKNEKLAGLPGWAEKLGGKKFGRLVKFNYSFFYLGLLLPLIAFFASEYLFEFLHHATKYKADTGVAKYHIEIPPVWVHAIVAVFIVATVLMVSKLSMLGNKIASLISQLFSWTPIIIVVVSSLVLMNTHNVTGPHASMNTFDNTHVGLSGLVVALPLTLMSYDAFLNVGVESHRAKNGSKTIGAAITIGMILVIILYTTLSISSAFHGGMDVITVVNDYINIDNKQLVATLIYGAIFGATLFGVNTVAFVTHDTFEQISKTGDVFSYKKDNKRNYIWFLLFTVVFWIAMLYIPSIVKNNDKYISFVGTIPTTLFFIIYAVTIIHYLRKRKDLKPEKHIKDRVYWFMAIIAITLIIGILSYEIIWEMLIHRIIEYKDTTNPYGLMLNDGYLDTTMSNLKLVGIFGGTFAFFFIAPVINYTLVGISNKRSAKEVN